MSEETVIWYKAWGLPIQTVEAVRWTEHYVWLAGEKYRHKRAGVYFPTLREAYAHLEAKYEREAEAAREKLARAEASLAKLRETYGPQLEG